MGDRENMISEEKVSNMTRMAVFEQKEAKKWIPMRRYFRKDYISLQMIRSFFAGTFAYILMLFVWGIYHAEEYVDHLDSLNYQMLAKNISVGYLAFMGAYLAITHIIYRKRYNIGKTKWKYYHMCLKRVKRLDRKKTQTVSGTGNERKRRDEQGGKYEEDL